MNKYPADENDPRHCESPYNRTITAGDRYRRKLKIGPLTAVFMIEPYCPKSCTVRLQELEKQLLAGIQYYYRIKEVLLDKYGHYRDSVSPWYKQACSARIIIILTHI